MFCHEAGSFHISYHQADVFEGNWESGGVSLRTPMRGPDAVGRVKVSASWWEKGPSNDGAGCCQLSVHDSYQSVGFPGLVGLVRTSYLRRRHDDDREQAHAPL
jgi:hypothetical protein